MYAQINQQEITELATKKASGLATQIYLVLSSHCWKNNECFPSLSRIGEMLGNVYHTNSIHRALKWLEDNGFIIRKAAKATNRFVMKVRALTKKLVSNPENLSNLKLLETDPSSPKSTMSDGQIGSARIETLFI
jgi:hypothetical protein